MDPATLLPDERAVQMWRAARDTLAIQLFHAARAYDGLSLGDWLKCPPRDRAYYRAQAEKIMCTGDV